MTSVVLGLGGLCFFLFFFFKSMLLETIQISLSHSENRINEVKLWNNFLHNLHFFSLSTNINASFPTIFILSFNTTSECPFLCNPRISRVNLLTLRISIRLPTVFLPVHSTLTLYVVQCPKGFLL